MHSNVHVYMTHVCWCPWRQEEIRPLRAGAVRACELQDIGDGNWAPVLQRSTKSYTTEPSFQAQIHTYVCNCPNPALPALEIAGVDRT